MGFEEIVRQYGGVLIAAAVILVIILAVIAANNADYLTTLFTKVMDAFVEKAQNQAGF